MLRLLSAWLGSPQSAVGEISLSGPLNAKLLVYMGVLSLCVFWCSTMCMLDYTTMWPGISGGGRKGSNVANRCRVSVDDRCGNKSEGNALELDATFTLQ